MPPKGRRGSLATVALKKTLPHWRLGGEALLFFVVEGPDAGGEAEGGVVGEGDGFVDGGDAEEEGDGAEDFFLGDGGSCA